MSTTPLSLRAVAALAAALASMMLLAMGVPDADAFFSKNRSASGRPGDPLVIGHRGAAGYRPEHTLAGYALAARMGADYIEPDLVSTKDGVLVARHENEIGGTTNVADHAEFAARKTTKTIDGAQITGWFTEDFTLAELKTLRAKERIPAVRQRNTMYDNRFPVPTFQEVIDLSKRLTRELGRPIGIYPETKHPTYFQSIGLPLEAPLVDALSRNRLNTRTAKVFVQSFETANLKELRKSLRVPLVQLLSAPSLRPYDVTVAGGTTTYADLASTTGLQGIAKYAQGVGPSKDYIVPRDGSGASLPPTDFLTRAHAARLKVHPYTFRNENTFLPLELRIGTDPTQYGNAIAEFEQFFTLGVDGLFTDNADTAVEARG
ncbi:MAG: glycerophosphodiester phosphodiesterase [Solirubrobacteraceae bacterium]|nr:glycerophosphodiester phosphodiesterase [Solirubrobacteraceae bacterium]